MKTRKHHNNKGYRQIQNGSTRKQVKAIAKKLGIRFGKSATAEDKDVQP